MARRLCGNGSVDYPEAADKRVAFLNKNVIKKSKDGFGHRLYFCVVEELPLDEPANDNEY